MKNPNLKKKFKGEGRFGVGGVELGVEWMNGQTKKPEPICLFNFFAVGGITMN